VPKEPFYPSPGWTNTIYTRNLYSSQTSTSRVHAMAAVDVSPLIVVYVTVPNKETGSKLAHSIIENKLAACVNQIPGVESTYWWQGKVETDSEMLLIIKTRSALLNELTAHVNSNHPYDTPEVIALPITGGSDKYLKWIEDSTEKAPVVQE
jgi:periplasmic divalent cation tolerance protein